MQLGIGSGFIAGVRQPQGANVVVELGLQMIQTPVHPIGKDRLGLIEIPRHASILRPTAREGKHHLGGVPQLIMVKDLTRIAGPQQRGGLGRGFRHQYPAFAKPPSSLFQGIGHIGQIELRVGLQIIGQGSGIGVERRLGLS